LYASFLLILANPWKYIYFWAHYRNCSLKIIKKKNSCRNGYSDLQVICLGKYMTAKITVSGMGHHEVWQTANIGSLENVASIFRV
jgi:hypothetical protein